MADAATHAEATGEDTFSFLKLIAEASAVFIGVMFVAGWSYLASYYKTFGLNPMELDIPVPVVATIALHMLYDSKWPLPLLAAILAALAIGAHRFTIWRGRGRGWVAAALILILFCCAAAALFRGRQMANQDMLEESPNLPLVAFAAKSEVAKLGPPVQPSCVAFETFGDMSCKLLVHSKEGYYFFRPIPKSRSKKTGKLDLYIIPGSDVLEIHVQRGVDLSGVPQ